MELNIVYIKLVIVVVVLLCFNIQERLRRPSAAFMYM